MSEYIIILFLVEPPSWTHSKCSSLSFPIRERSTLLAECSVVRIMTFIIIFVSGLFYFICFFICIYLTSLINQCIQLILDDHLSIILSLSEMPMKYPQDGDAYTEISVKNPQTQKPIKRHILQAYNPTQAQFPQEPLLYITHTFGFSSQGMPTVS